MKRNTMIAAAKEITAEADPDVMEVASRVLLAGTNSERATHAAMAADASTHSPLVGST